MSQPHPILSGGCKQNPGIYTPNYRNKNIQTETYNSIGDPYHDPHRRSKVNSRFGGKQMQTNPPKNPSGNVGHFTKFSYSVDMFNDKAGYTKSQPLDKRRLGFGSHDAARRDEFTTAVRTEQYREQLSGELKYQKVGSLASAGSDISANQTGFPTGLKETRHLYDIGRKQETAFDPKSSVDTFYNALTCKSRNRGERRNGGNFLSSATVGEGTKGLDHAKCKSEHGHVRKTKTFFDRSHLGESPLL
jgi:hypothetical protein